MILQCKHVYVDSKHNDPPIIMLIYVDFIEYLNENEVPVVDYDRDELKREFDISNILEIPQII